MRKIYPILVFLLLFFTAGFGQQRTLNQVAVPASLANSEKIQLNYTDYYTLGYEPLVGNVVIEATSWDGFEDKVKLSLKLTVKFNNPTKYVIYKEGQGSVKVITGTPAGEVTVNSLSIHVPVSYGGSSLTTPVFQFGFDKFNNLVSQEDVYISASLLKNYSKVGTATKIAGGGKEDAALFFKGLVFGIPSISHFSYFKFAESASTEARNLNDIALAAIKKAEDARKKQEDDLRKKQAAAAAAKAAAPAATNNNTTAVRTSSTGTTASGSSSQVNVGATIKPAEIGVGQDGKYYRKGANNTYQQVSAEEYQALKKQNAALKIQRTASTTTQQTNAEILAANQQAQQAMTDNFQNQIAESQRKSEERINLGMQSYYAAEAVRNGKENLGNLSSLSGNYTSVEELEAEFRQKYNSINQEVESLNQARDQQLQASYNSYALGADESGRAVGQAVVAVGGLINSFTADKEKREAKEALEKARSQANAALAAKKKAMLLQLRTGFFAQFPDGGVPLSSHKVSASELYFFSYIFDKKNMESSQSIIAVSNVFPVARYGDGTWPFKTNVVNELRKTGAAGTVTLVGYYASKEMADQMHASFMSLAGKCSFTTKDIVYKGKKSSGKTGADFWSNGPGTPVIAKDTATAVLKKEPADDFWDTGKKPQKTETKKTVKKDDFWNK